MLLGRWVTLVYTSRAEAGRGLSCSASSGNVCRVTQIFCSSNMSPNDCKVPHILILKL